MKKTVFLSILAVLGLSVLVSCSRTIADSKSTNDIQLTDEPDAFTELQQNIDILDLQYGITPDTKARRKGAFGRIMLADLGGFLGGAFLNPFFGLLTGILSSAICAPCILLMDTKSYPANIELNTAAILYNESPSLSFEDSIGFWHNKILAELYESDKSCFDTWTEEKWMYEVKSKLMTYFPGAGAALSVSSPIEVVNCIKSSSDDEMEEIFIKQSEEVPAFEKELLIIENYCESILTVGESKIISDYSTDFNKIIDGSKINPDSKSLIKGAISVAGSSELLWEK